MDPFLICLVGAECTGKTSLAQGLAQHFGGVWVPEFLRSFCELNQRTPQPTEQGMIMRAQFDQASAAIEEARQTGAAWVFCDAAPLLTAVYSAHYFSDFSLFESAHAVHGRYALHLVPEPDLPWCPDGLQRDSDTARSAIHQSLMHQLQGGHHPYIEIHGSGVERLQSAINAVETLCA
jgi:nicotinamide riboside kinase